MAVADVQLLSMAIAMPMTVLSPDLAVTESAAAAHPENRTPMPVNRAVQILMPLYLRFAGRVIVVTKPSSPAVPVRASCTAARKSRAEYAEVSRLSTPAHGQSLYSKWVPFAQLRSVVRSARLPGSELFQASIMRKNPAPSSSLSDIALTKTPIVSFRFAQAFVLVVARIERKRFRSCKA